MEEIKELKNRMASERPAQWSHVPDIELYMDQVLNYMLRQHIGLDGDKTLTSAMINNYTKKGLLPRANGKKYGKEHLAYLTAICLFKQVLSVNDTDSLLKMEMANSGIEEFYEKYRNVLDRELTKTSEKLDENMDKGEMADLILEMVVSSYTLKLACERLLKINAISEDDEKPRGQAKE